MPVDTTESGYRGPRKAFIDTVKNLNIRNDIGCPGNGDGGACLENMALSR